MSDSENQEATLGLSREATDVLVAIGKASGNITPAADFISDLEATITTLKAQLEAAGALRKAASDLEMALWAKQRPAVEEPLNHLRKALGEIALSAPASDTVGDCPFCGKEDWHPVDGYLGRFRCYSCGKWDVPASDTGSEEK